MDYLSAFQVTEALTGFAASFPDHCAMIQLQDTSDGRAVHALAIHDQDDTERIPVLVIGGVHAREWAPPDALIGFAKRLVESRAANADIVYPAFTTAGVTYSDPNYTIPADEVADIFDRIELILLPLVNPDGRDFSRTAANSTDQKWRKNRRRVRPLGDPHCVGVDINRNFPIAWFHRDYYHAAAADLAGVSEDPCRNSFKGPDQNSEIETQNVVTLALERKVQAFVDVHMFGRSIQHPWGMDRNQSLDEDQAFHNVNQNHRPGVPLSGRDGLLGDVTASSSSEDLLTRLKAIAGAMSAEIVLSAGSSPVAQRRSTYQVQQAVETGTRRNRTVRRCSDDFASAASSWTAPCRNALPSPSRRDLTRVSVRTTYWKTKTASSRTSPNSFRRLNVRSTPRCSLCCGLCRPAMETVIVTGTDGQIAALHERSDITLVSGRADPAGGWSVVAYLDDGVRAALIADGMTVNVLSDAETTESLWRSVREGPDAAAQGEVSVKGEFSAELLQATLLFVRERLNAFATEALGSASASAAKIGVPGGGAAIGADRDQALASIDRFFASVEVGIRRPGTDFVRSALLPLAKVVDSLDTAATKLGRTVDQLLGPTFGVGVPGGGRPQPARSTRGAGVGQGRQRRTGLCGPRGRRECRWRGRRFGGAVGRAAVSRARSTRAGRDGDGVGCPHWTPRCRSIARRYRAGGHLGAADIAITVDSAAGVTIGGASQGRIALPARPQLGPVKVKGLALDFNRDGERRSSTSSRWSRVISGRLCD